MKKLVLCLLVCLVLIHCDNNSEIPNISISPTIEKLKAGQSPGTYSFQFKGQISWSQETFYPIFIIIENSINGEIVYKKGLNKSKYEINTDLKPGKYYVISQLPKVDKIIYFDALQATLDINEKGEMNCLSTPMPHEKFIELIYPNDKSQITERKPLFKWKTLDKAITYSVSWVYRIDKERIEFKDKVNTNEYKTQSQFPNGVKISWSVVAFDKSQKVIGRNHSSFKVQ